MAIQRQTYRAYEQFVLEGLAKREAHDALYGTFMARAGEFDLFMKVDADMVIENPSLFAQIVDRFSAAPEMHMLTIAVHDYFSDTLIDGMHTFRSTVKWPLSTDIVYTDRHPVQRKHRVIDTSDLAPAAIHCKNPSPFQAFHYGMHRGVKARVQMERYKRYPLFYMRHIEATWQHFLRAGDVRLGFAALSAELALRGDFDAEHIAYTNPYAQNEFKKRYDSWDAQQVRKATMFLRARNRLFIPMLGRQTMRSMVARMLPERARAYVNSRNGLEEQQSMAVAGDGE